MHPPVGAQLRADGRIEGERLVRAHADEREARRRARLGDRAGEVEDGRRLERRLHRNGLLQGARRKVLHPVRVLARVRHGGDEYAGKSGEGGGMELPQSPQSVCQQTASARTVGMAREDPQRHAEREREKPRVHHRPLE